MARRPSFFLVLSIEWFRNHEVTNTDIFDYVQPYELFKCVLTDPDINTSGLLAYDAYDAVYELIEARVPESILKTLDLSTIDNLVDTVLIRLYRDMIEMNIEQHPYGFYKMLLPYVMVLIREDVWRPDAD